MGVTLCPGCRGGTCAVEMGWCVAVAYSAARSKSGDGAQASIESGSHAACLGHHAGSFSQGWKIGDWWGGVTKSRRNERGVGGGLRTALHCCLAALLLLGSGLRPARPASGGLGSGLQQGAEEASTNSQLALPWAGACEAEGMPQHTFLAEAFAAGLAAAFLVAVVCRGWGACMLEICMCPRAASPRSTAADDAAPLLTAHLLDSCRLLSRLGLARRWLGLGTRLRLGGGCGLGRWSGRLSPAAGRGLLVRGLVLGCGGLLAGAGCRLLRGCCLGLAGCGLLGGRALGRAGRWLLPAAAPAASWLPAPAPAGCRLACCCCLLGGGGPAAAGRPLGSRLVSGLGGLALAACHLVGGVLSSGVVRSCRPTPRGALCWRRLWCPGLPAARCLGGWLLLRSLLLSLLGLLLLLLPLVFLGRGLSGCCRLCSPTT